MKEACVVIPIHSDNPTRYELISFQQCFKILGNYPIKIVAPEGLSLNSYPEIETGFEVIYINPKWQSSIQAYNKLKTSRYFYNLFEEFDFVLTYELDAFIFRDELKYWCNKGYDYIGAPWFDGYTNPPPGAEFIGVGNSGFSLRRIKPIQNILKTWFYRNPNEYKTGKRNLMKALIKEPYRWVMNQTGENYTIQHHYDNFEDIFFSHTVPLKFKEFKIATIEDAIKFSFEVKPEYLFELNNRKLPMGCHAWWRYNLAFWKPFIEDFGYQLEG